MKYIRTKDNDIIDYQFIVKYNIPHIFIENRKYIDFNRTGRFEILKEADAIEDLIQVGDIVFYWQQSDDKEHCSLIVYDSDIRMMKYNAITKLLIPVGEDYKCVAKGFPSFSLVRGRRYLNDKGKLELL